MADTTGNVYKKVKGLELQFEVNVDVGDVTKAKLYILKPNKNKLELECEIDNDRELITYTTEEDDLDVVGVYQLQLYIEIEDDDGEVAWSGFGNIVKMTVEDTLG